MSTYTKSVLKIVFLIQLFSMNSSGQERDCLVCTFPLTPESLKPGQADACEDLYAAACVSANGKYKYQDIIKKEQAKIKKPVVDARNKAAQQMGYKDFNDALKSKLKAAGLTIKSSPDKEAWERLVNPDNFLSINGDADKIYETAQQCGKEKSELNAIPSYLLTEPAELKNIVHRYQTFQTKYKELSIKYNAQDIPNFVDQFGWRCKNLKTAGSSLPKSKDDPRLVQECANIPQLKRQETELFREEGSEGYQRKAEQFIRSHIVMDTSLGSVSLQTPVKSPPKSEVESLRDKIKLLDESITDTCNSYDSIVTNAGKKVTSDLKKEIARSRVTVESLIDSAYSPERQKLAAGIAQSAKNDIQDLVGSLVKDPKKRGDILEGYGDLKISWMQKPEASSYTKDSNGVEVLNEETAGKNLNGSARTAFFDPELSFFTSINAFYNPAGSTGKEKTDEQVTMQPAILSILDENPYAFLGAIAHESGHKIDPYISYINGYDLSGECEGLLNCYRDSKSIKLGIGQSGETMADYYSSEVLAREIQKLPQEQRKQALMSSMEIFCLSDVDINMSPFNEVHPETSLRIGGIYGANPSIRNVLGCKNDSSKFKTCGLNVSILDAPMVNPPTKDSGATAAKGAK